MATVAEQFDAAVKVVQKMPKDGPFQPSYDMKKRMYALFKQATKGPCNEPKPAFWEAIKRVKWEAWSNLGNMPKEEAMNDYINDLLKAMMKNKDRDPAEIQHIVETIPITDEVSAFLKTLGPFFEAVNEPFPVPEEEKWRFYDKVPTKDSPRPENQPVNGDVHTDINNDVNDDNSVPPVVVNHNGPVGESVDVRLTPVPKKGLNSVGPDGDVTQDQSHPFPSDESGNGTLDSPHDPSGTPGGDRSSGASGNINVTIESDTESEDFCDSVDQPEQLPELVPTSAADEPLRSITEEQVLMTSTPQSKKILTEAEVHSVNGQLAVNEDDESENHDGMPDKETPIARHRGGGEVTTGGKGQGGRGQDTGPVDQRSARGAERDLGQDRSGRERFPHGGQGGAPGGRDPSGRQGRSSAVDVSEQITVALQRLQCDMSSVLARLNTLEALALSQAQQAQSDRQSPSERPSRDDSTSRSWLSWLFPRNIPSRTVFFLLIWPLVVNIIVAIWRRRRHRHLRR